MGIQVSVVVPTHRRAQLLERCLQSLLAQDLNPRAYEIIVVDDANEAETRRVVSQVKGLPGCAQVRYFPLPERRGPAAARNCGWRAARGPIIAFTDDDCLPSPGWLRNGINAFQDGIMGASGRVVVPLACEPTDYELDMTGLERSSFVTANCFYRRCALERLGGFDESFTLPWREDSDLFFRMLRSDCRLVDAPGAVVLHPAQPAPWGVSLRLQRKSMFNALVYKKHPQLYRQWLQSAPPWQYYANVAALSCALIGGATGLPGLALASAAAWVGLTLRFCARRLRRTSRDSRHVLEMLVTSALIPPLSIFWRLVGAVKFRVLFL